MTEAPMANAIHDVKLLPCPFCSGEGLLHNSPGSSRLWMVSCKNCDCGPHGKWSPVDAIAAWNRRRSQAGSGWSDDVRGFLFAMLGADTWIEARAVWDGNPDQRKAAHAAMLASPAFVPVGDENGEAGRLSAEPGYTTSFDTAIDCLEREAADCDKAGRIGRASMLRAVVGELLASPAPSQHTGWSDEAVEAAAKALVTAKGTNPLTLFQFNVFTGDEPFDHEDDQGRRFIYSWRKQVENARAALTAASSIAPATGFEKRLKLAKEFHDGPLGADDHDFDPDSSQGKWCLDVVEFFDRRVRSSISPSVAKESGEP